MLYGAHFHVNAQIVLSFVVVYPLLTSYLYTQLGFFSGLLLPLMNFLKLPPGTPVYWEKKTKTKRFSTSTFFTEWALHLSLN